MAKDNKGQQQSIQQLQINAAAQSATPGKLLQFNPAAATRAESFSIERKLSADTLFPDDHYFQARNKLEELLGGFNAYVQAYSALSADTSGMENVLGFGVGFRKSGDALTADVAVKVYVREKLPLAKVSSSAKIPVDIDGVPTDVEAIGEVILHSYARRYAPKKPPCGASASNVNLRGSGTMGCVVVLNNNKLAILSNNHVLANENSASIGDDIIQPGNAEPGLHDKIGELENFAIINQSGNRVDAAVAFTAFNLVDAKHVTYTMNPTPLQATLGMTVLKNGRTTQATLGMVTDVHASISVGYDPYPAGAGFIEQIAIRGINSDFSAPGDSGALIVTSGSKQPVALLFAGGKGITFANRIEAVISQLGIARFCAVNENDDGTPVDG